MLKLALTAAFFDKNHFEQFLEKGNHFV